MGLVSDSVQKLTVLIGFPGMKGTHVLVINNSVNFSSAWFFSSECSIATSNGIISSKSHESY